MQPTVNEIADGIYRISTWIPDVSPVEFTFNQFLMADDEPLLFHTGPRGMFPLVAEAVATVLAAEAMFHPTCLAPHTARTMRQLGDLGPTTLALMHGPSLQGDCRQALYDLASGYETLIAEA